MRSISTYLLLLLLSLSLTGCPQNPPCEDGKAMGEGAHTASSNAPKGDLGNTECGTCDCGYEVIQSFPHDTNAFTQGFLYHDGVFYEGTGLYGQSTIRIVTIATGIPLLNIPIDNAYFGEGLALLDNDIYQLTWKEGIAIKYDKSTLTPTGQFNYTGEGWGLTTDGVALIMSNGTDEITFRNPTDFSILRTINVTDPNGSVTRLNELEYINGQIWANVWLTDRIVRIDPNTGNVVGNLDLTGILPPEEQTNNTDVLNGIAYDADNDRLFVTGKNWPKVYEIKLAPKA